MRWTALKTAVERFFAPSLKGRVVLRSIAYRGAHDNVGRGVIVVDGDEVWNLCTLTYWAKEHNRLSERRAEHGAVQGDRMDVCGDLLKEGVMSQWTYHHTLAEYLNSSIEESLASENPLARALAMLDTRLGKQRLVRLDMSGEHPMVTYFYALRCAAEGLVHARGGVGDNASTE